MVADSLLASCLWFNDCLLISVELDSGSNIASAIVEEKLRTG